MMRKKKKRFSKMVYAALAFYIGSAVFVSAGGRDGQKQWEGQTVVQSAAAEQKTAGSMVYAGKEAASSQEAAEKIEETEVMQKTAESIEETEKEKTAKEQKELAAQDAAEKEISFRKETAAQKAAKKKADAEKEKTTNQKKNSSKKKKSGQKNNNKTIKNEKNEKKRNPLQTVMAQTRQSGLSKRDRLNLMRIVEAEATGEDIKGKMLVASVVLNRVKSEIFPDTVTEVVFQNVDGNYQFSPLKDGRFYQVSISKQTRKAVRRVLAGEDESNGALYFMARRRASAKGIGWFDQNLTKVMEHGGHEFFQ